MGMSFEDEEHEAEMSGLHEVVLGTTAHLLADMGDQQASLLLEDVKLLTVVDEPRGPLVESIWGGGQEQSMEGVAYLDVEPWMQPRFDDAVLGRILVVMAQVSQRILPRRVAHLETRLAIPAID